MANEKKMDQVLLGLLSHDSLTGYQIKKRIDSTLKYFWSASYGSIYPTLNTLVNDGMVTKFETTENGREKVIYTITEKGRRSLKEWLATPATKDELHYETLLKIFFGSEAGSDITVSHVQNFEDKIKKELPALTQAIKALQGIQGEDTHRYYMLTAMFGEKVYQTYIEWCEEAKKILKSK